MVLSKSLILRFFCRFVGKNVTKFLCYIDLLKVTKLTRLVSAPEPVQIFKQNKLEILIKSNIRPCFLYFYCLQTVAMQILK